MIATIDGWAGAGKTTLASFLEKNFADKLSVFTLHMDDLYDGWAIRLEKSSQPSFRKSLRPIFHVARIEQPAMTGLKMHLEKNLKFRLPIFSLLKEWDLASDQSEMTSQ